MADRVISGRVIVAGEADGEALVTHDALSFWGGYDFHTGEIIDKHCSVAAMRRWRSDANASAVRRRKKLQARR